MSVRVVAPCRLHFGLFHVPVEGFTHWPDGRPVRKFGGVGLMVEPPAVRVGVRRSGDWSATGSLAARAMRFLRTAWDASPDLLRRAGALAVAADGPPEHVGLGIGTALGMAVVYAAAAELVGRFPSSPETFARVVGRGRRSGIGVHGFSRGGLIVDAGKECDTDLPQLDERVTFPAAWRVVLLRPRAEPLWHGDRERVAFGRGRSPAAATATTDRLQEIAYHELIPAAKAGDFFGFAEAVYSFNRTAGEPFADDQGGPYAGPAIARLIGELRSWGVAGVGQSSWGPTVFALAADEEEANALAARARCHIPDLADVTVAAANNRGAASERIHDPDQPDQEHVRGEGE